MKKGVLGLLLVALAVFGATMAGCGGDSDGDGSSAALTKAEFLKQGNAVCERAEERRGEAMRKAFASPQAKIGRNATEVKENKVLLVEAGLPSFVKMTEELDQLGAPEGEEEKVQAIIEAMEEAAGKAESDPLGAAESNAFWAESQELLQTYGLTSCLP